MALRLVACMLLLEITAFMRETFQTLPKASRASQRGERPPPWERVYTGLGGVGQTNANRRWSMALSSMGHSQASAQSLQSIAGTCDQGAGESGGQPHGLQGQHGHAHGHAPHGAHTDAADGTDSRGTINLSFSFFVH